MTLHQFGQSSIFDHQVDFEIVFTTFISSESVNLNILVLLSFSGLVELLDSFETSKYLCFDIILSTGSTFPKMLIFYFTLKDFVKVTGICTSDFHSILKDEWNIASSDLFCFVIRKNATDSNLLYSEVSCLMTPVFFDFFVTGFERYKFGWKERYFLERPLKEENLQFFYDSENDLIVTEVNSFRELLKLSGGSQTSSGMKSNTSCEIADSVESLDCNAFFKWKSLTKVIFTSPSHLREVSGFGDCTSLCRIEIPSSVEKIGDCGFYCCTSLNQIIFSSNSHLREISSFGNCTSFCRIEIPSSVEVIGVCGFNSCQSLGIVICQARCRIRKNGGLKRIKGFVIYEHEDTKERRRLVHHGIE
jgi:hypothetical protein